ncbi:phosphodiesterase, MJ0936 family [Methanocaldococcus infernus ME]|uniref:Phosphoesterase n=1 Tax=Methanocaldococcus infernus (strain DSM 11812 / JCM 15783 / ME) TaxID=573063 RepID=D5VRQ3_METIM|nr:YfcE family phosphodiesterase [Methanocaldococcus infernus]ADG13256.1 phosphodiesterase, MJ0936 family [Methanocaldococcus infernus ME]
MLIGIISDTHIYDRASSIPKKVFEEFSNVDLIIHCGDITDKEILDELSDLARVIPVQGNCDYLNLPREQILELNNYRIGVIHGDIIYPRGDLLKLKLLGLEMGVDILISGHTHWPIHEKFDNLLLLNPGSPTVPRCPIRSVMKLSLEDEPRAELVVI